MLQSWSCEHQACRVCQTKYFKQILRPPCPLCRATCRDDLHPDVAWLKPVPKQTQSARPREIIGDGFVVSLEESGPPMTAAFNISSRSPQSSHGHSPHRQASVWQSVSKMRNASQKMYTVVRASGVGAVARNAEA
eukprot:6187809-Pleurochrysis_carterae.AAC.2